MADDDWKEYQDILDKPETDEYNDLDRAFELLDTLLDDPCQLLGDGATNIIEHAMNFLK